MYLHIGNNKNIRTSTVIGIFDADSATVSPVTRSYLAAAERKGRLATAKEDLPKSFVIYTDGGEKVCFSQLSTSVLLGRAEKSPL